MTEGPGFKARTFRIHPEANKQQGLPVAKQWEQMVYITDLRDSKGTLEIGQSFVFI